jgi:hypothetical protein
MAADLAGDMKYNVEVESTSPLRDRASKQPFPLLIQGLIGQRKNH